MTPQANEEQIPIPEKWTLRFLTPNHSIAENKPTKFLPKKGMRWRHNAFDGEFTVIDVTRNGKFLDVELIPSIVTNVFPDKEMQEALNKKNGFIFYQDLTNKN